MWNRGVGDSYWELARALGDFQLPASATKEERDAIVVNAMPLLRSANVEVRSAAASVLSNCGSHKAIRLLLGLLKDSSFDVRLSAVQGLSRPTNKDEEPGYDLFRANEPRYTGVWTRWAAENGY